MSYYKHQHLFEPFVSLELEDDMLAILARRRNRTVVLGATYWAIQAGLLTPLTFARHCLSPLAAFTSGGYFLHN